MYLIAFVLALLLSLVITPAVIRLARRIHAMDRPCIRSVHDRPVARIGGLAIFLSALLSVVAALVLDREAGRACRAMGLQVLALATGASCIFVLGLIDDLRGLSARVKFLVETILALALCAAGIRIYHVELTEWLVIDLGPWGCLWTWLWIVGVTNAVNISDGLDGLAGGISAITCAVIAIASIYCENVLMSTIMLGLLGGLCGFLVYNFSPAKVFMGDCGSLFVGFTIASASVMCLTKSIGLIGLGLPLLSLGVPILDTILAMLRRYLDGRSLFAPDRCHFHHHLLELGLKQRDAVLAIYATTAAAAGLGLCMIAYRPAAGFAVLIWLVMLLAVFRLTGAVHFGKTLARFRQKLGEAKRQRGIHRTFEDLQLCLEQARDLDQWWEVVCHASRGFGLRSITMVIQGDDGSCQTRVWHGPAHVQDGSRPVWISLPLASRPRIDCQIVMTSRPSLEWAGQISTLFGRLVAQYGPPHPPSLPPAQDQTPPSRPAAVQASRPPI